MYRITPHAARQAAAKGVSEDFLLDVANNPSVSYSNGRYPGQMRHIKDGWVAVVSPVEQVVITLYRNVLETPLRPDQVRV